jgi:hypothetical protein
MSQGSCRGSSIIRQPPGEHVINGTLADRHGGHDDDTYSLPAIACGLMDYVQFDGDYLRRAPVWHARCLARQAHNQNN